MAERTRTGLGVQREDVGALPALSEGLRTRVAAAADVLAKLSLAGLIVLSAFRARIVLESRPLDTVFKDYVDFLLYWSDFFLLALIAFWAVSLLMRRRPMWLGPALVRWPAAALLAAVWLSVPFSVDPALSAYTALRLMLVAGLALYVANEVRSVRELVPAIALMVALQAVVSIGQVLSQDGFGLSALGEHRMDASIPGSSVAFAADGTRLLRGTGLTDHPNILGGVLAFSLLILGVEATRSRQTIGPVLVAVFALGAAALLLSFSRSAVVGLATGLVAVFGLLAYRRDWANFGRWAALCLAGALVVAVFVMPYSDYLITRADLPSAAKEETQESRSLNERAALAENANEIFIGSPLTGIGAAALPTAMYEEFPDFRYNYQPAHFVLLDVAAETGIFGALAYGALLVGPWLLLWLRRRSLTPELIAVSGALLATGVVGLFDYYTWGWQAGRVWAWLVLGLWLVAYRRAGEAIDA